MRRCSVMLLPSFPHF